MEQQPLYKNVFQMLDYAESIYHQLPTDDLENNHSLITLVYIEDIVGTFGRDVVMENAMDSGVLDDEIKVLLSDLDTRVENLRDKIRTLVETYQFDQALQSKATEMVNFWRSRHSS